MRIRRRRPSGACPRKAERRRMHSAKAEYEQNSCRLCLQSRAGRGTSRMARRKRRSRDFANGLNAKHFWWRCARGKHPFPSRTRRLRPGRPMVLCWGRHGRAGGRQTLRGYSSVGRAPALQAGGQGFESLYLHEGDEESARGRISGAWLREVYLPADTGTKDCEGIRRMPVTKYAKHMSPRKRARGLVCESRVSLSKSFVIRPSSPPSYLENRISKDKQCLRVKKDIIFYVMF